MRNVLPWVAVALLGCASPTRPTEPYFEGVITSFKAGTLLPTILVEEAPLGEPDPSCERASYYAIWNDTQIYRLGGGRLTQNALVVGATLSVESTGDQLDSCPPVRRARRIFVHDVTP